MALIVALAGSIIAAGTIGIVSVLIVRDHTPDDEVSPTAVTGPMGPRGIPGVLGFTGQNSLLVGLTGFPGVTGRSSNQTGPQGPSGLRGPTGVDGGVSTVTGPTGFPGFGSSGPTGLTGPTGSSGLTSNLVGFLYNYFTDSAGQVYPNPPTQLQGTVYNGAPAIYQLNTFGLTGPSNTQPLKLRITVPAGVQFPTGTTATVGQFSGIIFPPFSKLTVTRTATDVAAFDLGFMDSLGVFTPLDTLNHITATASIVLSIVSPTLL